MRMATGRPQREASLGLQVIDAESGGEMASRGSELSAFRIRITPDGASLFVNGLQDRDKYGRDLWTEVLDAQSLKLLARLEKWEVVGARRMDGQTVYLASQPLDQPVQLAVLDPRSFEVIHSWTGSTYASWITTP